MFASRLAGHCFLESGFSFDWLYKIYLKLIPKPDLCFVCLAKGETLKLREKGGEHKIGFYHRQRKRYLAIAQKFSFPVIDSNQDYEASYVSKAGKRKGPGLKLWKSDLTGSILFANIG